MKYFEKRKLVNYLKHLEEPKVQYPQGYIDSHKPEIEMLKWLVGYYEGRTASKPIEYFESLLKSMSSTEKIKRDYTHYANERRYKFNIEPMTENEYIDDRLKCISFLYNWIYYKKIIGF